MQACIKHKKRYRIDGYKLQSSLHFFLHNRFFAVQDFDETESVMWRKVRILAWLYQVNNRIFFVSINCDVSSKTAETGGQAQEGQQVNMLPSLP